MKPRVSILWLVLASASLGIAFQFLQREDTTSPFAYFTIWSAATWGASTVGAQFFPKLTSTGWLGPFAIGSIFSGVIYGTIIAPINGLGQTPPTIVANVLLHGALPVSTLVAIRSQPKLLWRWPATLYCLAFPLIYLLWTLLKQSRGGTAVYAFLDENKMSTIALVGSVIGATLAYVLVIWAVARFAWRTGSRRT